MSRSYKHKPITGWTTAESEKQDKRYCNRRLRRKANKGLLEDDYVHPKKQEITDVWSMDKDGKQVISADSPYYRKSLMK
jgi:hypothetical protein